MSLIHFEVERTVEYLNHFSEMEEVSFKAMIKFTGVNPLCEECYNNKKKYMNMLPTTDKKIYFTANELCKICQNKLDFC